MNIQDQYEQGVNGWVPDHQEIERIATTHSAAVSESVITALPTANEDTLLYQPLLKVHPTWRRGAQGIGDCVSWGYELACTMLMAIKSVTDGDQFLGEAATEPIYGGSRVEARGGRLGGYSDGSYGAAAAKWVNEWGVLVRSDYSKQTGNPEHNLTSYDKGKAKSWGNYGCGGQRDERGNGPLDQIARQHPVQAFSLVTDFESAAKAIMNGYPVPVCSGQGFNSTRDADGFCRPQGSWAHCMLFGGVRFGARPGLLLFQSWGHSTNGPRWPLDMPDSVAFCSWWVDVDVVNRMLRQRDSFALSHFKGFPPQKANWKKAFSTWN